ncbi:uncharacterized protein LOC120336651 [Styela clava]
MRMENLVELDHTYSHHWSESYKTNHNHAKPIHWLLSSCRQGKLAKGSRLRSQHMNASTNSTSTDGSDDEIDVESLDEVMEPYVSGRSYDVHRAKLNMNETERFTTHNLLSGKLSGANMRSDIDWEEYINKTSWSMQQTRLYTKVVKLLEDEKLARLAFKGVNNEPIARRLSLDRSAACLRRILAEFSWEQKLTQWLHYILINRLPASMLASYLDLIQTLRSKVPTLVERMIAQSVNDAANGSMNCLEILLKRPWEPMLLKHSQNTKQKSYDLPIILVVPNSPYVPSPTMSHRKRFWNSHLGQVGKVVMIAGPEKAKDMTILAYIEQLSTIVRTRINLYHTKYPDKPIILAGWHTATILNCHIALAEKLSAIICFGFPMQTLNGSRGTVDDVFCDLNTPILFVVGEEADLCDIDQIEDFREKLLTHCQSNLLAVPGADDALRVSDKVKKTACVTQTMVDKMILHYIEDFLSDTLIKNEVETWTITESSLSENFYQRQRSEGKRKRDYKDNNLSEIKRRRLSSSTTAKISEILSGQSSAKGKHGTKTPVQGVTFNLQTGSMSGLATVPTVLGRSLSKNNDSLTNMGSKLGKVSQKNKNQQRSITIDLTKDDTSQRVKSRKIGTTPDPSLLATESQTEAAVATILGGSFSEPKVPVSSVPASSQTSINTDTSTISTANSSDLAGSHTGNVSTAAVTSLPTISNTTTSLATAGFQQTARLKSAYSNVRFNSTVLPKQPADIIGQSAASQKQWSGISSTNIATPNLGVSKTGLYKKYPYLASHTPVPSATQQSHIASRSRKDERETMQATAFLEQLTSGDDVHQSSSSILSGLAETMSSRRHSYDSTHLLDRNLAGSGRGRVRTRGGSSQGANSRVVPAKRRKTINEERPNPTTYYQQKVRPQSQLVKQESYVRYVMTPDMSTMLSNAAAKAAASSNIRGFTKPAPAKQVTLLPDSKPKPHVASITTTKPALLPVYTFHQPHSSITVSPRIQHLAQSTKTTKVTGVTQSKPSGVLSQISEMKKSPKVFLSQRVPVKFPGAAPGSSYTFVTIPALVGTPVLQAGHKTSQTSVRRVSTSLPPKQTATKVVEKSVKYTVLPKSEIDISPSPNTSPTVSANTRLKASVSLREKALARGPDTTKLSASNTTPSPKVTSSIPVFASPSVVLQKLSTDTVTDLDKDSKPKK